MSAAAEDRPERIIRIPKDPGPPPVEEVEATDSNGHKLTIQERFEAFHAANPRVYELLVELAREALERRADVRDRRKRLSIQQLFEIIRWDYFLRTTDEHADWKINDAYTSRYARLIHSQEPDLKGVFELRKLRTP